MKLSKKTLAALSAATALVVGGMFTSCSDDDDDDPEGAISGSNNSYTVDYNNAGGYTGNTEEDGDATEKNPAGNYRAWKRTTFKHRGALVKITLKEGTGKAGANDGTMGFVWDLVTDGSEDGEDDTKASTFNLAGIVNDGTNVKYYVSRYYNITNKQALNFGATTISTKGSDAQISNADVSGKKEWDITDGFKTLDTATACTNSSTGNVEVWIDAYAIDNDNKLTTQYRKLIDSKKADSSTNEAEKVNKATAGAWIVDFYYKNEPEEGKGTPDATVIIPAKTGDDNIGSGYSKLPTQTKQAVYANIYKDRRLVGAWDYVGTYAADEVVEE